jgi:hypothetical protein
MRKAKALVWAFGVILLWVGPARAQDATRTEIFGGYSYFRFRPDNTLEIPAQSFNGANGSIALNFAPALGAVAEFSGYHTGNFIGSGSSGAFSYLFGPKISMRNRKVDPFFQTLFGGTRIGGGGAPGFPQNGFTMAFGAGIDLKTASFIAIRIIQADYVFTRFNLGDPEKLDEHNLRFSFGVVFRLGKKWSS